jgi:hypothetical protein
MVLCLDLELSSEIGQFLQPMVSGVTAAVVGQELCQQIKMHLAAGMPAWLRLRRLTGLIGRRPLLAGKEPGGDQQAERQQDADYIDEERQFAHRPEVSSRSH